MRQNEERAQRSPDVDRRRIDRLTVALREAKGRGELVMASEPEAMAHFLVASLKGAVLVSQVTHDFTVMQQCMRELDRYLALYEVQPALPPRSLS